MNEMRECIDSLHDLMGVDRPEVVWALSDAAIDGEAGR